ncbi:PBP1A family penicillin-binding protein [Planktomarina sp.]|nr:PBP1A family penicillin-binding protein [Planktomarina sp.]
MLIVRAFGYFITKFSLNIFFILLRIIGALFSTITLAVVFLALFIGAVIFIYGVGLPSHKELASYQPKTISRIYSASGHIIDEFATERRLFAAEEEIPNLVKEAFISAEDKNFYTHVGYDPAGMAAALRDAVVSRGKNLRGASTITQQVMKNFLLDGSRSAERKVKELILSTRLENTLEKDEILELYLNEIFLGQNSYGVAAAAQTYFNKSLKNLLPEEVAYLAILPKAPSKYHPVRQRDRAISRRNFVLKEMNENNFLSDEDYELARNKSLKTVQNGDFTSFRSSLPKRDYPTDEIRRQLSRDFGEAEFFTGGYSVRATIDPSLQNVAAQSLRLGLENYDRAQGIYHGTGKAIPEEDLSQWRGHLSKINIPRDIVINEKWSPAVVLEIQKNDALIGVEGFEGSKHILPSDDVQWVTWFKGKKAKRLQDILSVGDVILVSPSLNATDGQFLNWSLRQIPKIQGGFVAMDVHTGRVIAMQGGFSYEHSLFNRATQAMRQPGSSFKPFVYAAALDSGYSPATIVIDAPIEEATLKEGEFWRPKNYTDKFYGPSPVRKGIEESRNLMTVRLAKAVGMKTIAAYAEKFGVYENMKPYLSMSLGSQETTLYKMVSAYAMFANGGERVLPTLVDRVQDRDGNTVFKHDNRSCEDCKRFDLVTGWLPEITSDREKVMDQVTAFQLTSMMEGVVDRGTARRTVKLPVPVAGKTGTTNEAKDVWFVGFTSNLVAGCYMGMDQPSPLGKGSGGGGMCGPVFDRFMNAAIEKYGAGNFKVPKNGNFINMDRHSGARLQEDAEGDHVIAEFFRVGEEPKFGAPGLTGDFKVSGNIPLFDKGETEEMNEMITSSGKKINVAPQASIGTISSGGLY